MNRRTLLKAGGAAFAAGASLRRAIAGPEANASGPIERWDLFELSLNGPREGNPFRDVWLQATFRKGAREVRIDGFYDGDGVYRIRFMPDSLGEWSYSTNSNSPSLKDKTGSFEVIAPAAGNHGAVRVRDVFHFGFEDGTAYFPFGTTCYAWLHQSEERQQETLASLWCSHA
jgi:hypothetical protein